MRLVSKFGKHLVAIVCAVFCSSASLQAGDYRDDDLLGAVEDIARFGTVLSISETVVELDGLPIGITDVKNTAKPDGPFYPVLHDDEDSAFKAALRVVGTHGGHMVAIESFGNRYLQDGADPNRLFGLRERGDYTAFFERLMADRQVIIAPHNNVDGWWGRDGRTKNYSAISINNDRMFSFVCKFGEDEDDLILGGSKDTDGRSDCQKSAPLFAERQFNYAHVYFLDQTDQSYSCERDCHLQKWVTAGLGKTYFNVETQHGKLDLQIEMIEAVLDSLQE